MRIIKLKKKILWLLLPLCLYLTGCGRAAATTAEIKTVTLAVFQSESELAGSQLLQWVNIYNERNSDVNIEILHYMDNDSDPSSALNQIKVEISAGKGPDLIDFGRQYSPLDASSGILVDLKSYLQRDGVYESQNFYNNILDSFAVGDDLYVLVPNYKIDSYTTMSKELAGMKKMNVKQLTDAYNALDSESILFPGETKKSVFAMLCFGSLENYIDWENGTCKFTGDSFQEMLNFANQFPSTLHMENDYSVKTVFTEGHALLYPVTLDNVYGTTKVRLLYGETPTYIGYPMDAGNGNMAAIVDTAIGISSASRNKEEAWKFIESLLSSEFQNDIKKGLPLRVSSLEQKLTDSMEVEYDIEGEKIVKDRIVFEGEDPVNIYEIEDIDAETLKAIIGKVQFSATIDPFVYNIVLEESEYLFHEDRKIEEVADIIQNRASIYIEEHK